jgi:hypothetical protein
MSASKLNADNLNLACTGVGLLPYALSSSVAIIPWSVTFVYFGSLAKNMADILEGRAGPKGAVSAGMLGMSGVLLVAVVVYSTVIARCVSMALLALPSSSFCCRPLCLFVILQEWVDHQSTMPVILCLHKH